MTEISINQNFSKNQNLRKMKSYIGKVEILKVVPNETYPSLNDAYEVTQEYYTVIQENQPIDEELVRVSFVMWADGIEEEKIKKIIAVLNNE